jgi:hypothetical protein
MMPTLMTYLERLELRRTTLQEFMWFEKDIGVLRKQYAEWDRLGEEIRKEKRKQ